jgi:hypothetical protein
METFKNIIEYFSLFMTAVMLVLITNKTLQIFQQSHYQFRSFKKNIKHYYLKDPSNFWPPYIFFFFYLHLWYIQLIYGIYLGVLIFFKVRRKSILKLKFTARIKRIYFLLIITNTLIASVLSWQAKLPHLGSAVAFLFLITPFIVYFTALLIQPLEILISSMHLCRAKRKLVKIEPVIIGITGSYGKTGTKNILFSFLQDKYMVLPKTPLPWSNKSAGLRIYLYQLHDLLVLMIKLRFHVPLSFHQRQSQFFFSNFLPLNFINVSDVVFYQNSSIWIVFLDKFNGFPEIFYNLHILITMFIKAFFDR